MRNFERLLADWVTAGCLGPEPLLPEDLNDPWPGDPVFCTRCTPVVRAALRALPDADTALEAVKYTTRTTDSDEVRRWSSSSAPASPSPGADHQDEILHLAAAWEDDLRRHLGHPSARRHVVYGNRRAVLTEAVEYLNTNYAAMIEREAGAADFGREISVAHAISVRMVKNGPLKRHLTAQCPSCDACALVQQEGVALRPWYVECVEHAGGCGRLFAETEYEWLVQLITGGHVPAGAAA